MSWRKYILHTMLALLSFSALAEEGKERLQAMFSEANEAYRNTEIAAAKDLYTQIIEEGYVSAKVYFNLANCYYKEQSYPSALLYFERAKRLAPNDEDIAHNLRIAQMQITDKVEELPTFFFVQFWNDFSLMQSSDAWSVWFIIMLLITCTGFTIFLAAQKRGIKQLGLIVSVLFLIVSGIYLAAANRAQSILEKPEAIVFDPSVSVKSEPSMASTDQFVIHAGLKVEVLKFEESWSRIRLQNGNSGWVKNQSIERI